MSLSSRSFRGVFVLTLIATLSLIAFADTIRLKDGSILKGKIVGFGNGKFTVSIGDGSRRREMIFLASEIESIIFDAPNGPPQISAPTNRNASYAEPRDSPPTIPATNEIAQKPDLARQPSSSKMKPISWRIKVLADNTANGWTNSGWVIKKGQRIRITGEGRVSLGRGQNSPTSGIASLADDQKLLKNVATGALIAVIGDDNNDFIHIGSEREFTATRDGALFLGINEGYLEDNSGAFDVKIEILPDDLK